MSSIHISGPAVMWWRQYICWASVYSETGGQNFRNVLGCRALPCSAQENRTLVKQYWPVSLPLPAKLFKES